MEKATFGAGCFWGVEETFRQVRGVTSTAAGYMGGDLAHPTYQDVCSDRTGHAEVVQVTCDPAQVSYDDLLKVFWENHDPTTLNPAVLASKVASIRPAAPSSENFSLARRSRAVPKVISFPCCSRAWVRLVVSR